MIKNKDLKRRIIEISYKLQLGHIGSCLTAVDIIDEIYKIKKPDEKFILSAGHAGLALYVVLEKKQEDKCIACIDSKQIIPIYRATHTCKRPDAEEIFEHHGVHPDRCIACGIDCSSGSLGHGIGIALGMALDDRLKNVYCVISDGECSEGSVWEALRIQKEQYVDNLLISCAMNGFGAYKEINQMQLSNQLEYMSWCKPVFVNTSWYPEWLAGQQAHYKVLNKIEYEELMEILR